MDSREDFDLQEFLPYLLNIAAERTSADFQVFYKARYGLLRTEWRVLFHLGIFGALTAKDICEKAHIHKTKVSRAVARLEKRRLIERKSLEHDRRFESLKLTKKGQSIYLELSDAAKAYHLRIVEPLSNEQFQNLKATLKLLALPKPDSHVNGTIEET